MVQILTVVKGWECFSVSLNLSVMKVSDVAYPSLMPLTFFFKKTRKIVKGLRHVPYETVLQRLQLFSLIRRRIRGDFICMYNIMHGLLDFPCDAAFAAPTRIGLRGHTLKIHQQRCKIRRRQHVFSVRVVLYWSKLPEDIVTATSVETFKFRLDVR